MSKAKALVALAFGALVAVAAGGKKKPDDDDDGGREPEGGGDPDPQQDTDPTPQGILDLQDVAPADKRKGSREPWAVVLHQMGFSRGDDPMRYRKVTAHFIITPNGTIAQLHPITTRIWASNGFNQGGIAIEFVGNFPSRTQSQNPNHFYKPEKFGTDQLTVAQVKAGRWLLEYLRDSALPALGLELRTVLAHRQSSGTRGNDPGPDVWTNVGQWAVEEMGLSDGGEDFFISSGKPIREDWRTAPRIA